MKQKRKQREVLPKKRRIMNKKQKRKGGKFFCAKREEVYNIYKMSFCVYKLKVVKINY
jgi:hypothetical protein